jgi:hypothetical protein
MWQTDVFRSLEIHSRKALLFLFFVLNVCSNNSSLYPGTAADVFQGDLSHSPEGREGGMEGLGKRRTEVS